MIRLVDESVASPPASVRDCWRPRFPVVPEVWVTKNIYFTARSSAVAGHWSHTRFPYSREPLNLINESSVQEIVLNWGTQLGKTAMLGAAVCWVADNDPSAAMIAAPNIQMAHEHYRTKLEPAMEDCKPIAAMLPPKSKRHMELVDLGAMWIYYAYSGGKSTLSGRSIRYLFVTEINLWDESKSREGDPLKMARDRTKAFPNRKIFIEGKPTLKGECRITAAYELSDQRTYHVACPHCGEYQQLVFGDEHGDGGLKWNRNEEGKSSPGVARTTAYYQCAACKDAIREEHKLPMLRRGVWVRKGEHVTKDGVIAGNPENPGRIAGFHLSSLYSTLLTWGEFAEEFLLAKQGSLADLQAFVNGWLAEPFDVNPGDVTLADEVHAHEVPYEESTLPEPAVVLCTVDVQKEGLWYLVRAWGEEARSWLLRYGYLGSWSDLTAMMAESYPGPSGELFSVKECWLDSGGNRTVEVYKYCAEHRAGPKCVPIKGGHQYRQAALIQPMKVKQFSIEGWSIDAGQIRDQFYGQRLKIRSGDPGYWAIYEGVGSDYVRSITSWVQETKHDPYKGLRRLWRSRSARYEHLADCEIYQEAMAIQHRLSLRRRAVASRTSHTSRPSRPKPRNKPIGGPGGWG